VTYLLAAVFAGIVSVDRFAAFNLMLSRPLVVAFVLGFIFNAPRECFFIGLVFEAIGLIDVPFGTRIPKEDTFGTFAACTLFAILPLHSSNEYVLGLLLAILMMFPVTMTCGIARTINMKLFLRQQRRGRVYPGRLLFYGVMVAFFRGVVVYSLGTFLIYLIYNHIEGHLDSNVNLFLFALMVFVFLSGYILRFLTVQSYLKYAVFSLGLLTGWLVL
jgi:PTS system mannose-specific IIC component